MGGVQLQRPLRVVAGKAKGLPTGGNCLVPETASPPSVSCLCSLWTPFHASCLDHFPAGASHTLGTLHD